MGSPPIRSGVCGVEEIRTFAVGAEITAGARRLSSVEWMKKGAADDDWPQTILRIF
jgi:hypothetical protein